MADDLMRRIADELEIRNTIGKILDATDNGTLDEYCSHFIEDADWTMHPSGGGAPMHVKGVANLRTAAEQRRAAKSSGPESGGKHVVVVNHVTLNGDRASATSYMSYVANADKAPAIGTFKTYHDEFVRTPGGWKLAKRLLA